MSCWLWPSVLPGDWDPQGTGCSGGGGRRGLLCPCGWRVVHVWARAGGGLWALTEEAHCHHLLTFLAVVAEDDVALGVRFSQEDPVLGGICDPGGQGGRRARTRPWDPSGPVTGPDDSLLRTGRAPGWAGPGVGLGPFPEASAHACPPLLPVPGGCRAQPRDAVSRWASWQLGSWPRSAPNWRWSGAGRMGLEDGGSILTLQQVLKFPFRFIRRHRNRDTCTIYPGRG